MPGFTQMCRYQQKMTLYRAYMVLLYTRFCFVGESGLISWKLDSQSHAKLRVLFWHRHKRGQQGQGLGHGKGSRQNQKSFMHFSCPRLSLMGQLGFPSPKKTCCVHPGGCIFAARLPKTTELANLALENGSNNLLTSWEWLAVFLGLTGVVFLMQWGQALARAIEIGSSHVGFL